MNQFIRILNYIKKAFNSRETKTEQRISDYFRRKWNIHLAELFQYAKIGSSIPDTLSDKEVVAALIMYLTSENTPASIIWERHPIHKSWMKRFDEAFFLALEEIARDFRILQINKEAIQLLEYGLIIAEEVGLRGISKRLKGRRKIIIRGTSRHRL